MTDNDVGVLSMEAVVDFAPLTVEFTDDNGFGTSGWYILESETYPSRELFACREAAEAALDTGAFTIDYCEEGI